MRLWVLVYDVADDRRRRRLAGVLGRRAERVQESVFEAWLSGAELHALLAEVAAVIEPAADAVRAYPLALRDRSRRETLGDQPPAPRPAAYWIG
ncbi:MAG: CRISPR-associated endonuclease Cas2 [Candidatus Accumulibacter similis]|nr:MAG: CRISPR-associated endonuclease Cas2 [Candidatus Accumulibacter similis]